VRNQTDQVRLPVPSVPSFEGAPGELLKHIEPVASQPLTFRTCNLAKPEEVTLIPFYRTHHQRYSVYWDCRAAE